MSTISKLIKQAFSKHPIITNAVVYGTLFVGAEFSQQTVTRKILADTTSPYDTTTLKRYTFYGTTIQGPLLTIWYRWLDKKFVGTSAKIIIQKVLVDQFFFTPQLLVLFYVAMSIMEHKSHIFEECKQKFIPTFQSSCMFWLPAQSINFTFIPSTFRVVYVGACSFAWINILCWIKRQQN